MTKSDKDIPKMAICKPDTKIEIKKLTELDPNKIYVLKVDIETTNMDVVGIQKNLKMLYPELEILVISHKMEFIEPSEAIIINLICKNIEENGKIRQVVQDIL